MRNCVWSLMTLWFEHPTAGCVKEKVSMVGFTLQVEPTIMMWFGLWTVDVRIGINPSHNPNPLIHKKLDLLWALGVNTIFGHFLPLQWVSRHFHCPKYVMPVVFHHCIFPCYPSFFFARNILFCSHESIVLSSPEKKTLLCVGWQCKGSLAAVSQQFVKK